MNICVRVYISNTRILLCYITGEELFTVDIAAHFQSTKNKLTHLGKPWEKAVLKDLCKHLNFLPTI